MTDFYGTGRSGEEYPDPAGAGDWPGRNPGNPGAASGGFQVSAQPPLAGYPSPGSATASGPYGPGPYGGYPPPGAGYPGHPYPAPAYAYGAPPPSRPGTLVGAAVLAFITGGLDVMGGIFTMFLDAMSPLVSDLWWAQWLWVVTLVSLVCGGLLIGGGVVAMRGPTTLLLVGAAGTAAIAVYWLAVIGAPSGDYRPFAALRVYPAIYLALCAVMVGLALAPTARGWRPDRPVVG